MDAIYFRCENCAEHITASAVEAGTKVICPYCNAETIVPKVSDPDLKKLYEQKEAFRKSRFSYFIYLKYFGFFLPLFSIIKTLIRVTVYPTIESYVILELLYSNLLAIFVGAIFYLACLIVERITMIEADTAVLTELELLAEKN